MLTRICILEEIEELTFAERLDERARSVAARALENPWESSARSVLEQEIALTINHIDNQNALKKKLEGALASERFYVYREVVQQKQETHYRPYRPNSIDNLKARLGQIDSELRKILIVHQEALERLHDRLLMQILRHAQATNGNNGYRDDS